MLRGFLVLVLCLGCGSASLDLGMVTPHQDAGEAAADAASLPGTDAAADAQKVPALDAVLVTDARLPTPDRGVISLPPDALMQDAAVLVLDARVLPDARTPDARRVPDAVVVAPDARVLLPDAAVVPDALACVAGASCVPVPAPTNPCVAFAIACTPDGPFCVGVANQPDGTACGTGLVCASGQCSNPTCGTSSPSGLCCQPATSAWPGCDCVDPPTSSYTLGHCGGSCCIAYTLGDGAGAHPGCSCLTNYPETACAGLLAGHYVNAHRVASCL